MKEQKHNRNQLIQIRVSRKEKAQISKLASLSNLSISDYMRACSKGIEVEHSISQVELSLTKMISQIGNNVNHIYFDLYRGKVSNSKELVELCEVIKRLIDCLEGMNNDR